MANQNSIDENQFCITHHLKENIDALPSNINVVLTNLKGEILFEEINADCIDISNLSKGLYIVFLMDLEGSLIKKIKVIK